MKNVTKIKVITKAHFSISHYIHLYPSAFSQIERDKISIKKNNFILTKNILKRISVSNYLQNKKKLE